MRRATLVSAGLLAALLLGACALGPSTPDGAPPDDFRIRYDWHAGTVPPPYHYEYTITIAADGSGSMAMTPDYPGPDVPVWEEPFTLPAEEVARLYALVRSEGILNERWRELDQPPVGGEYRVLELTAGGRTVQIPAFPAEAQRRRAERLYAAVESLVPQPVRDDLEQRRAAYEAANTRP